VQVPQPNISPATVGPQKTSPAAQRKRAIAILAKSIYKEIESQGFDEKEIVALAGELISEVTTRLGSDE